METFQLSRKKMSDLLFALKEVNPVKLFNVLELSILDHLNKRNLDYLDITAFISSTLPPIYSKLIGVKKEIGFSINEIVSLGNSIEYTNLSSSAVQNWVKREMKELVGSPQFGKKYTIEQTAILLIVEDLKSSLDFETIRRILALVFNNPADRTDDLVDPLDFYAAYATIYEKILHQSHHIARKKKLTLNEVIREVIIEESKKALAHFPSIKEEHRNVVMRVLVISTLTIQTAYYQTKTKKHVSLAFLDSEVPK